MSRKSWVQCRKTGKFIPKEEYYSNNDAHYVMTDLKPYKSMITGEIIQGRAQHRAHLRQHGCIEVGNEKITPNAPKAPSKNDYKRMVAEVMSSKGY